MHRGSPPKQAIAVTMASKNFNWFLMDAFLLKKIHGKEPRLANGK